MRWFNSESRKDFVVDHPLRASLVWGVLVALLVSAFEGFAQQQPVDPVWIAKRLAVFVVVAPAWGYLTRWAILRRREDAR